jgi:predicted RNA-binding protein YlxR (DUF448 family)
VGCRQRAAKDELLRIAVTGGECVPDPRGTLPGRGAYLHPDMACYDLAVRRRAFPRAYRAAGALGTEELRLGIEQVAGSEPQASAARGKERHG